LIALEQINLRQTAALDRVAENERIAALPGPPAACQSFVAIDSGFKPRVSIYEPLVLQVDAMLIAQRTGIPTINGYSGLFPSRWNLLQSNQQQAQRSARNWITRHNLSDGICLYDRGTNRWHMGIGRLTQ